MSNEVHERQYEKLDKWDVILSLSSGMLSAMLDVFFVKDISLETAHTYSLLTRLDSYLLPLQYKMEEIMENEGLDYSKYSDESKKSIATVVSTVSSIKAVLDTAILTAEGSLTDESKELLQKLVN